MSSLSTEVLYRKIADAKQICSEFTFKAVDAKGSGPGYAGVCGFISFTADGIFTVKPGYVFDGASGPTIDTDDCICAALGHDVMYELMDQGKLATHIYKDIADLWFYKRLQTDGMLQYRAWAWFRAVSIFGKPGFSGDDIIHRAPIPFTTSRPTKALSGIPGY
jgi:hypothetical protein